MVSLLAAYVYQEAQGNLLRVVRQIIMRGHLKKYDGDANDLTIEWQLLLDAEQMEYPLNTRLAVYRDVYATSAPLSITV